jgi:hypothetical protein
MDFEYRVVPAPKRLKKVKGVSASDELCAATLTEAINAEARQGWEYLRAETFSAQTVRGIFRRSHEVEETVLVFRRERPLRASLMTGASTTREAEAAPAVTAAATPAAPPATPGPDAQPVPAAAPAATRGPAAGTAGPQVRAPRLNGRDPDPKRARVQIGRPARSEGEEPAPSLLRPVPRHRPDEPS